MILGVTGIIVMRFAPRGLWGLISERTGVRTFPVRRKLLRDPDGVPTKP